MTAPAAPPPASMQDIVALARSFAAARQATEALAEDIKASQRKALAGRLRALRSRIAAQAASEDALRAAIQARPDLFVSPRTVAVDGVKFGLRKLPAAELAQIGVTIEKATDEVTIAAGRTDLDRVVAALLDDAAPAEAA